MVVKPSPFDVFLPVLVFLDANIVPADGISAHSAKLDVFQKTFIRVNAVDDDKNAKYPMPIYAENHDEVYVGRIRLDYSVESGCNLFVVADNIRKGAATNALQIAQLLLAKGLVK